MRFQRLQDKHTMRTVGNEVEDRSTRAVGVSTACTAPCLEHIWVFTELNPQGPG